jgi:hypothetical protein
MQRYKYIACVFAGSFLANVVPHFVHGILADRFPTPFAKPPSRLGTFQPDRWVLTVQGRRRDHQLRHTHSVSCRYRRDQFNSQFSICG